MCGIVGIKYNNITHNGLEIYEALLSIQHRGQDGAGISYMDNNKLEMIKGKGLIYNLFSYDDLKKMNGSVFLGHTRYKTNNVINSFQPFYLKNEKLEISFCHNGNIINVDKIEIELNNKYKIKNNRKESDSFILFQLIFLHLYLGSLKSAFLI